jgi:hypothetical protein
MSTRSTPAAFTLGLLLAVGLALLGYLLADGLLRFKALDRTVSVKGLAEREVPADIAIWPIKFSETDNDLGALYTRLERNNVLVREFLRRAGFGDAEITVSAPAIFDRKAQAYGNVERVEFRYAGTSALTVYSPKVEQVRTAMQTLAELGKQGVAIAGEQHDTRTEFLFTGLNDIKPAMIEEATKAAREVAEKFARDSDSRLGKIRTASQGLFSIQDRDSNTPHIKRVRVVSTVEYYLVD